MGRTSKFSFPVPGKGKNPITISGRDQTPPRPYTTNGLSKAQRILGLETDLNIDCPVRDDEQLSARYTSPKSIASNMSFSISESTQSTSHTSSLYESRSEQRNREHSRHPKARPKASSTILGQSYETDTASESSSGSRKLGHEKSSSTLKSYYDRQKSPLAISQQTSESSARDLALRKGQPSVISTLIRSPLLHVDTPIEAFEEEVGNLTETGSREKLMRRKPPRLDLSMLFSSRGKRGNKISDNDILSRSSTDSYTSGTGSRKYSGRDMFRKANPKDVPFQNSGSRPTTSLNTQTDPHSKDALFDLYESYEKLALPPVSNRRPEPKVPGAMRTLPGAFETEPVNPTVGRYGRRESGNDSVQQLPQSRHKSKAWDPSKVSAEDPRIRRMIDPHARQDFSSDADRAPFSWKHMRESMPSERRGSNSASVSSHNTKTSRHTNGSTFSNSDLKQSSILSLSSDSDDEESDRKPTRQPEITSSGKATRILTGESQRPSEAQRRLKHASPPSERVIPKRSSSRKAAGVETPFLAVPESSNSRLSGPWYSSTLDSSQNSAKPKVERKSKRTQSAPSKRLLVQPTSPLSPTLIVQHADETDSGRFMEVTEQEEALLAALRQKRACMRERIIEEHEIRKSPLAIPGLPDRKNSRDSSIRTLSSDRAGSQERPRIVVYLGTPVSDGQFIDTTEPAPGLSDDLGIESDGGSTPRTAFIPKQGFAPSSSDYKKPKNYKNQKLSPTTPPGVARLSAVGTSVGFRGERAADGSRKRYMHGAFRFADDAKIVPHDFLLEEGEDGVIWGM